MKTLDNYHVYLSCCHLRFECKETEHLPWVVSANYLPGDNHTHKYLFPSAVSKPTEWKDEQRRPSSMCKGMQLQYVQEPSLPVYPGSRSQQRRRPQGTLQNLAEKYPRRCLLSKAIRNASRGQRIPNE
ncbi:hypothetical protein JMJ77_0001972 [Colletotrichum scovillei]|uniref:Uncharacterized protein n=1 Tax=Colletotrichum scovillei TaxID=1209932 RepID=A0A9P7UD73_9PEZI|nr:hypothetical protein JMJ77_0001972 [Colletotrichum scovillei]KAG7070385.1 hypothetical protein JMJ76_0001638 [Colletotrichum scovillei]KAG7078657.1 hypothetical protein JMJ78_0002326 [Colletotrichum scovillei]